MNQQFTRAEHMREAFRAMNAAIRESNKKNVDVRRINRATNPAYQHTIEHTQQLMSALINTGYLRYNEYQNKRYYCASKLGQERWNAYLGASLMEIQEEAQRRSENQDNPSWNYGT